MSRVFVARLLPGPALERLAAAHDVEIWPERLPPPPGTLRARCADAEGVLSLLTDRLDTGFIDACPRLTAISNYAVGYDNVDVDAATARGIRIGNTPDVLTDATADLAFALLLAAARKIPEAVASVCDGDWLTWEPGRYLGASVHGATLGVIGFGRIVRAVAQRATGFDMRVIHADTRGPHAADELGTLLAESDFVSVHCPLTAETHHLIDDRALAQMRPGAILINTARGPIVDQVALRHALVDGVIAGAALDVTDPEPLPPDDPLLGAPNLIVVPHIGSATNAARQEMANLAVENLLAGLAGREMPHQVNSVATR
jgi:glyoxylate reductase